MDDEQQDAAVTHSGDQNDGHADDPAPGPELQVRVRRPGVPPAVAPDTSPTSDTLGDLQTRVQRPVRGSTVRDRTLRDRTVRDGTAERFTAAPSERIADGAHVILENDNGRKFRCNVLHAATLQSRQYAMLAFPPADVGDRKVLVVARFVATSEGTVVWLLGDDDDECKRARAYFDQLDRAPSGATRQFRVGGMAVIQIAIATALLLLSLILMSASFLNVFVRLLAVIPALASVGFLVIVIFDIADRRRRWSRRAK